MPHLAYIIKRDGSVVLYIEGQTHTISPTHKFFDKILQALNTSDEVALKLLLKIETALPRLSDGRLTIVEDTLLWDNKPMHNALSKRIVEILNEGLFSPYPLINFFKNTANNPNPAAVDQLYGFLDACNLPITEDGCFLAYKYVRNDYYDNYTGTIRNRIGDSPSMPYCEVDGDPNVTCSHGLHVASRSYVEGMCRGDTRMMVCKVNPADVVSVPVDYNQSKMRVCKYTVIAELTDLNQMPSNFDTTETEAEIEEATNSAFNDLFEKNVGNRLLTKEQVFAALDLLNDETKNYSLAEISRISGINTRTLGRIRDMESYQDYVADYHDSKYENEIAVKNNGVIKPSFTNYQDFKKMMNEYKISKNKDVVCSRFGISKRVLNDILRRHTYRDFYDKWFDEIGRSWK